MEIDFTPEILLQFIYKETSEAENLAILQELKVNEKLAKVYVELLDGIEILDKAFCLTKDFEKIEFSDLVSK